MSLSKNSRRDRRREKSGGILSGLHRRAAVEEKVTFFLLELLNQVCQLGKPIFAAKGSTADVIILLVQSTGKSE